MGRKHGSIFSFEDDEEDVDVVDEALVNAEDDDEDYREGYEVEDVEDHAKMEDVVEAELAMDPAAATEAFIRREFGLSVEDLEEIAEDTAEQVAEAEAAPVEDDDEEELEDVEVAVTETDDDVTVGIDTDGDDLDDVSVAVAKDDDVEVEADVEDEPEAETEMSSAQVAATEALMRNLGLGREDVDDPENDVNLNVSTPDTAYDIGIDGTEVSLKPDDEEGGADDGDMEDGSEDDEPVTDAEGDEETSAEDEDMGEEEDEEEEASEEFWSMI